MTNAVNTNEINWTPVETGLPEKNARYLVTLTGVEEATMALWFDGAWWETRGVLAWAPLPEPWRG